MSNLNIPYEISIWKDIEKKWPEDKEITGYYYGDKIKNFNIPNGEENLPFYPLVNEEIDKITINDEIKDGEIIDKNNILSFSIDNSNRRARKEISEYGEIFGSYSNTIEFELSKFYYNNILDLDIDIKPKEKNLIRLKFSNKDELYNVYKLLYEEKIFDSNLLTYQGCINGKTVLGTLNDYKNGIITTEEEFYKIIKPLYLLSVFQDETTIQTSYLVAGEIPIGNSTEEGNYFKDLKDFINDEQTKGNELIDHYLYNSAKQLNSLDKSLDEYLKINDFNFFKNNYIINPCFGILSDSIKFDLNGYEYKYIINNTEYKFFLSGTNEYKNIYLSNYSYIIYEDENSIVGQFESKEYSLFSNRNDFKDIQTRLLEYYNDEKNITFSRKILREEKISSGYDFNFNLSTTNTPEFVKLNHIFPNMINNFKYFMKTPKNLLFFTLPIWADWEISITVRMCQLTDNDIYFIPNIHPVNVVYFFKNRDNYASFKYLDEKKVIVIGSNTMTSKNKVYSPQLVQSITGISTLTFSLYKNYWDDAEQKFIDNPFIDLLVNETKIKLNKNGEWFDFLVKSKDEDAEQNIVTYTCKDIHATSLSKQGFDIELSKDLFNNQGTIKELTDTVLRTSEWQQDKSEETGTEIIYEKKEETLYKVWLYGNVTEYPSPGSYYAIRTCYDEPDDSTLFTTFFQSEPLSSSDYGKWIPMEIVYIHYSDLVKEWKVGDFVPCFRASLNNLQKDENEVIDDWDRIKYFKYEENDKNTTFSIENREITSYRSKRRTDTNVSKYIPEFEKYIQVYYQKDNNGNCILDENGNKKEFYSFIETEYITSDLVSELMVNGGSENGNEGILSDDGWISNNYITKPLTYESKINTLTDDDFKTIIGKTGIELSNSTKGYIKLDKTFIPAGMYIYNSAINSNKNTIKNFSIGDKYIFELDAYVSEGVSLTDNNWLTNDAWSGNAVNPSINIKGMKFTANGFDTANYVRYGKVIQGCRWKDTSIGKQALAHFTFVIEIENNLTESELEEANIALQIYSNLSSMGYRFYIYRASFYKMVEDDSGYIITPSYTLRTHPDNWGENGSSNGKDWVNFTSPEGAPNTPTIGTKVKYNIYDPSQNENIKDIKDLTYVYQGYSTPEDNNYEIVTTNEKVRNIEAKQSNIFNILQSLSEAFECWCKFKVDHNEDGSIKLSNPPLRQEKYISFHNFIGDKNDVGLRYGTNVENIQRNIDSDTFVTKLIVPENITEYGEDGLCTIARADDNIGKDKTIYNLEYYIQMGLLSENTREDLNNYLSVLGSRSEEYEIFTKSLAAANLEKIYATSEKTTWENFVLESEKNLIKLKDAFNKTYGIAVDELKNLKNADWPDKVKDPNTGGILEEARIDLTDILTLEVKLGNNTEGSKTGYYLKLENAQFALENAINKYNNSQFNLEIISETKKSLYKDFTQKYGLYLQEGTWSSSNYIDDNLYYLDAMQTLALSAKPQISYSISALDLQGLEGYENYTYKIGDRSTIEDTEFFGWTVKQVGDNYIQTPYKESIVVSEITINLDDPTQDSITVQNYRTQFEDLFQKIAAETQSLQYKEGNYDNAAGAVDTNGQILPDAIANTFNNSSFVISQATDQGLTWNNQGITATDQINKSLVVNIKGGCIRVSSNGGATWSTSITGAGINANTITTGTLNANLVNIKNGDNDAFRWTKEGIVATLYDEGIYDFSSKITLNQYGLYGGLNDNINLSSSFNNKLNEIHQAARFALTWKGFSLKTGHHNSTGYVAIDSNDDFTVNVKANTNDSKYQKIIQIGHLETTESTSSSDASSEMSSTNIDASSTQHYGIRIKDLYGNIIFNTTEDGTLDGRFHINCGAW